MCVLPAAELEVFLERYRHDTGVPETMDPGHFIQEVLQQANAFVPSEAGSVLLDHPFERSGDPGAAALYFIAAFGPSADSLLGASIPTTAGVVGHVYRNGESHLGVEPRKDPFFYPRFDETHAFHTESLLAVPIRIENSVCGVLEMVNRLDGRPFDERDRALLEIFASYTSVSIQNLLDARRAGAAARNSIGLVLVGGLFIGTMFTLFVVPSIYMLIARDHGKDREREALVTAAGGGIETT